VITLRNRLLPLVSLREMFGLAPAEVTDANKVVVVSLGEGTGTSVGVVMDSIKECCAGSLGVDGMPSLLAQNRSLNDIQSICRLEDGASCFHSVGRPHVRCRRSAQAGGRRDRNEAMTNSEEVAEAAESDHEEKFGVFRLMNEEYGVPIAAVQEIVRVPEVLIRVPKTPVFIEGVINLRGSVQPVVDQRRRFGLEGIERNERQRIMVFTIAGIRTGFIVDSVSG
jgi:purine-binding chemotaxis protein CheW